MTSIKLTLLEEIFNIKHGNKFDKNKMKPAFDEKAAIAFISRSGTRNGLSGYVRKYNDTTPFEPGLITVALGVQPYRLLYNQSRSILPKISTFSSRSTRCPMT